jgi:hypothetical protein
MGYVPPVSTAKRLGSVLVGSAALWGCTGILGSFDVSPADGTAPGDETTVTGEAGSGSDSSMTITDGSGPGVDSSMPLVCKGAETKCPVQGVCAVLATSGDNCGVCGHSCGGGVCDTGSCQPVKIYDATPLKVGPVAVGHGLNFFFATTDGDLANKISACPVATGCKLAPTQLAVREYSIDAIASVNTTTVTFLSSATGSTERNEIYACSPTGCPSPPVPFVNGGLNGIGSRLRVAGNNLFFDLPGIGLSDTSCAPVPGGSCTAPVHLGPLTKNTNGLALDATNIYFATSTGIQSCLQTDTACTPATLLATDLSTVQSLAVDTGKLYWILPGPDGSNAGKLFTCDLPACATSKLVAGALATSPLSQNELYADVSGQYWITQDSKIQHCLPAGCTGGPRDFAISLLTPHSLTADDSFIYWAETNAVWRLAK